MSILKDLGIDEADFTWRDLSLCDGIDNPEVFFDEYEKSEHVATSVDEMCLSCPVMAACARDGQEGKRVGVWGGIYWNGNGKPDANRNSHKTPKVWESIKERLTE